jgi:hypothetical protein
MQTMNQQPLSRDIASAFSEVESTQEWAALVNQDRQWAAIACSVRNLCERKEYNCVQAAFDRLEYYLEKPNAGLHDWVAGLLQVLQDGISWSSDCGNSFHQFLGARTRRLWSSLDLIRCDLADCSTLEAEILMWRVIHPGGHVS